jgi:hypothetical protein
MKAMLAGLLALSLVGAATQVQAKTITSSQGNANENSAAGVAGTAPAANNSTRQAENQISDTKQPSKKVLKKTQIKPPPPLHDPN